MKSRREIEQEIGSLVIVKSIIECKDRLNDEDRELINQIQEQINELKRKLL